MEVGLFVGGLLGGLLLSIAWWYVMAHWVTPKLVISRRIEDAGETKAIWLELTNVSRFRSAIDITISADMQQATGPKSWGRTDLTLVHPTCAILVPGDSAHFHVDLDGLPATAPWPLLRSQGYIPSSTLEVHVFAYDGFSGSRRHFQASFATTDAAA